MLRRHTRAIVVTALALVVVAAGLVAAVTRNSTASSALRLKATRGDIDSGGTAAARPRGGSEGLAAEDYRASIRAYPAAQVAPAWLQNERATFGRLAARTPEAAPNPGLLNVWQDYGPQQHATEPGILNFSGATYHTASRTAALAISPTCGAAVSPYRCRMWAGPVGGGIWRTDDATAPDPVWQYVSGNQLGINSIGKIVLDPNDPTERTLYVGTGEPNNCSSGCEAGVGVYKSTDAGSSWTKLGDTCVSNAVNACSTPGVDAFLGRGISEIVVERGNPQHLFVGSAVAARSISHVIIGPEAQVRDEPGANPTGLYESTDGGATFTPVWLPYATPATTPVRRGIMDVGLDPLDSKAVYASALARGVYRRCPTTANTSCGGEVAGGTLPATDFKQVFAPRLSDPLSRERTMFDLTVKNSKTRIYITTGENGGAPFAGEAPSSFWRTDNANQTSSVLLASEPAGAATPPAGSGNPFPATYNSGWQILTANSTASPYWATRGFCTGQCAYDQDVYTPRNRPDDVYVIGSYQYGEIPCYTKGVGCGSGISDGRGVLYSNTAGDPDPANGDRTFTDMTFDAQNVPASWCALGAAGLPCLVAQHSIHPDQHEILINPARAAQFFEGSDGGINRASGTYTNLSRACSFRGVPAAGVPSLSGNALVQCQRLLSRIPTTLGDINTRLGNTIQFENVAVDPLRPCNVIGGTQDNGTWMPVNCDPDEWTQVIYGDGGDAGFDSYYDQSTAATGKPWVFNEFTGPFTAANFRGGTPDKWVDIFYPMLLSGENVGFYWPQISDPNPPLFNGAGVCNQQLPGCVRTHPIYSGLQHVWRSWAFGAGSSITVPQQVTPDIANYEANCPDFFATPTTCGDFQPLGGPVGTNSPGDLTGTGGGSSPYGTTRPGSQISWVSRRGADRSTMWATTSTGRVFITRNADALDPASVVWYRLDSLPTPSFSGNCPTAAGANPTAPPEGSVNCSPDRHPNGIYPDPSNPNVAYIAYSGFNGATPGTPGHVFRVTITNGISGTPTGATFTNLGVEGGTSAFPTSTNSGDLPINDIVMDDATGALYAASDFGVLKGTPGAGGSFGWTVTPGMPRQEITHLAIVPGQRDACRSCSIRLIYAATHAQGVWLYKLS